MVQKRNRPGEGRKVVIVIAFSLFLLLVVVSLNVFYRQGKVIGKVVEGCQSLPAGAVSWFNGEKIGSSSFFADKLLNNFMVTPGTISPVSPVPDFSGNAFGFTSNGMTDFTSFSTAGLNKDHGTVELWIKPEWTGNDDQEHGIWQLFDQAQPTVLFTLFKTGAAPSNTLIFKIINGGSVNSVSVAASALFQDDSEWTHLTATWNFAGLNDPDNKIKLYINDGVPVESAYSFPPATMPGGGALGISKLESNDPLTLFYSGLIDEVRLYDRALDATEILQLSQSGSVGVCPFESNCADEDDDDNDGTTDCGDSDCAEHPACGSALETGFFCSNGLDDDDDDFIDCFDSSCFSDQLPSPQGNGDGVGNCFDAFCSSDPQCRGQVCLTAGLDSGTIAWSYQLPVETSKFSQQQVPSWTGCCTANQCWQGVDNDAGVPDDNRCYEVETTQNAKALLCDADRNWYTCQEEGQLSLGGKYECVANKWKVHCSSETKYWLEDNGQLLCDGENWRDCNDLRVSPILDLNVQVIHNPNCTPVLIEIHEKNCNNGLDDDNDGQADEADSPDCQGNVLFDFFGNPWYEVKIQADDDYQVTLRKAKFVPPPIKLG